MSTFIPRMTPDIIELLKKKDAEIQKKLDAAIPLVGVYIAAASLVCFIAMLNDALDGFISKKLRYPCKLFSLNAASLTVLAVATKLSLDLNSNLLIWSVDMLAKWISLSFMSTAMSNFMPSLGSMTNKELLANVVALGILVVTIVGNMCIQLVEVQVPDNLSVEEALEIMVPMVFSFVALASLAVAVPTMKRSLESKFQEKHRVALREEELLRRREAFKIDDERGHMMKYFVMAVTSSPQFVMARSVVCSSSTILCFSASITFVKLYIRWLPGFYIGGSTYGSSTLFILYAQCLCVVVGMVAPMVRWSVAIAFKWSTISWKNVGRELRIEAYWTQTLVEWRESFSHLQIRDNRCRKYLHNVKWFALTFCIGIQLLIVLLSKLLFFLSVLLIYPFFFCYTLIKKFAKRIRHGDKHGGETDVSLNHYVLVLEGEPVLPTWAVKNISNEADKIIKTGKKQQPKSLVDLLNKSVNFKGVLEFNQIETLHSKKPPNSWALPIVTLTSIAIALPNIAKHERRLLLSSVGEGLSLVNIEKAADIFWGGVVLYQKWLDIDLGRMSVEYKSTKALLQELSKKAESIMEVFKKEEQNSTMENPLNWPPKLLAARSMYRISRTILLSYEDEGLYERLSVMIADVLAGCLTNLPRAITTMCHRNAIEKREENVREAFFLLGKTEQVVQLLQQKEGPNLDHDKAAYIEEWRSLFQQPQLHHF